MITLDYSNKVVLITGAGGGIGRLAAEKFAEAGASLALSDINLSNLESLQAGLSTDCFIYECNVANADDIKNFTEKAHQHFGRIDVAINNAGILHAQGKLSDLAIEDIDKQFSINGRGVFLSMKYQLEKMHQQGSGVILNMSSAAGIFAAPGGSAYSAAKHAVTGMTRSAAIEYARYGIRVNCLCPSFIDSPMVDEFDKSSKVKKDRLAGANPMKRLGTMEEVVNTMLWVCSDYNSYMNGQAVAIDGGLTAL